MMSDLLQNNTGVEWMNWRYNLSKINHDLIIFKNAWVVVSCLNFSITRIYKVHYSLWKWSYLKHVHMDTWMHGFCVCEHKADLCGQRRRKHVTRKGFMGATTLPLIFISHKGWSVKWWLTYYCLLTLCILIITLYLKFLSVLSPNFLSTAYVFNRR